MTLRTSTNIVLIVTLICAVALAFGGGRVRKTKVNGVEWHDSYQDALEQSRATGKPVLLLSMFGKLDEETPCANARTLRATLFKDPEFKKLASEDVVLAWEMVRAVPKVEIDLGDGKKIKRTVRGNAVMYLCNSNGNVVDAYPGVYTPSDFMPMIREAIPLAKMSDAEAIAWHEARAENAVRLATLRTTMSKVALEGPILNAMGARPISGVKSAASSTDPKVQRFERVAATVRDLSLTPMASDEVAIAVTNRGIEGRTPEELGMEILMRDSQNNVNQMRSVIHLWLASEKELPSPAKARDTVLERILKIPYKDPYFGLRDIIAPGTPF